jgi:hypothetical protein
MGLDILGQYMEIKYERTMKNGDLKRKKKTDANQAESGLTSYISTLVVLEQINENT